MATIVKPLSRTAKSVDELSIKSINFDNFKSYKNGRLPLDALTVLIGANASGKSNAIEAMRLLSWLAQGQKLSSIQHKVNKEDEVLRGLITDLPYKASRSFSVGCETYLPTSNLLTMKIAVKADGLHIVGESIEDRNTKKDSSVPLYTLDQPSTGRGSDVGVAYNNFARGGKKPHITCSDQLAIFTQLTSPSAFQIEHHDSRRLIPSRTREYERWLSNMLFLDPVPALMRDYHFPVDKRLRGDGSNLSGILFNLWGENDYADISPYDQNRIDILSFIQSLPEQDIKGLNFLQEPRGGVMVSLTETFGGGERECVASILSDGTLRVLAIAAAMLSAEEGSLVVIEEIDNGVHPSRAEHLLKKIQALADRRKLRVLLSTHNPALLDALPDSALPAVVFCYRDVNDGSSRLIRLKDLDDYPELVAQGSLGDLVTSGTLERFVKSHKDRGERRKIAIDWLKAMRRGS